MNISEGKGHKWLLKQGYKEEDIVFQRKGIDFICADGKGYEVKRLYGHVIWFHKGQLERTKGENNSVLVFDDDLEEPVAILASNELEKDKVILGIKITVVDFGKNFKYVNVKEGVIEKIKSLEENKKAIEDGNFKLATFVTKILWQYINKAENKEPPKNEGLTTEQVKHLLSRELRAFFDGKKIGNSVSVTSNQEGPARPELSKEDLAAIKEVVGQALAEAMNVG